MLIVVRISHVDRLLEEERIFKEEDTMPFIPSSSIVGKERFGRSCANVVARLFSNDDIIVWSRWM